MSGLYSIIMDAGGAIYVSNVKSPEWPEERIQIDMNNGKGEHAVLELSQDEAFRLEDSLRRLRTSSAEGEIEEP